MKFLRKKITIVFIVVMSVLCLVAVVIAGNVTTIMIKRKAQIAKSMPSEEVKTVQPVSKTINVSKITEQVLYFNGEKLESINGYVIDKKELLLPIDDILKHLGINYHYFNSDDLLQTNINDQNVIIRLWNNSFMIGDKKIELKTAPVAAKDHVLVPVDMFTHLEGFSIEDFAEKETVFVNYYKGWTDKKGMDLTTDNNFTLVEETDTTAYSPDKKKMLYYKEETGYYVANSNGTGAICIGNASEAKWVNNSKIFLQTDDSMYVVTKNGKTKTKVTSEWRMVGQTLKGEIFFTKGNTLYYESKGVEKKVTELPWEYDYVYAPSVGGGYIIVSSIEDGVFYVTKDDIKEIGMRSELLSYMREGNGRIDYRRSITSSPDGKSYAIFQIADGFVALNIVSDNGNKLKKVVLNCVANSTPKGSNINSRWVSNTSLFIFRDQKRWIIDFGGSVKMYDWTVQ